MAFGPRVSSEGWAFGSSPGGAAGSKASEVSASLAPSHCPLLLRRLPRVSRALGPKWQQNRPCPRKMNYEQKYFFFVQLSPSATYEEFQLPTDTVRSKVFETARGGDVSPARASRNDRDGAAYGASSSSFRRSPSQC